MVTLPNPICQEAWESAANLVDAWVDWVYPVEVDKSYCTKPKVHVKLAYLT